MAYDLSNDLIVLQPVDYSKGILGTVKQINDQIEEIVSKHNGLDKDTQDALNDLQSQIDQISGGDLDDVKAKIEALKELLGEGDTENKFLDVIDLVNRLIDVVNAATKNDVHNFLFNSDTGEVIIDLSAYGFKSPTDYEIMVSMNGDFMAPVTLQVAKVDEKTAKTIARDLRHFAEYNVKYTDGGTKADDGSYPNAFPFSILVSYKKVEIDKKAPREPVKNDNTSN